jgi:hypothetical protein
MLNGFVMLNGPPTRERSEPELRPKVVPLSWFLGALGLATLVLMGLTVMILMHAYAVRWARGERRGVNPPVRHAKRFRHAKRATNKIALR